MSIGTIAISNQQMNNLQMLIQMYGIIIIDMQAYKMCKIGSQCTTNAIC